MQKVDVVVAEKPARPFLKWAGGKKQLLGQFVNHYPKVDFGRYFEPFVGGGAVFFSLDHHTAYINDINTKLMACYEALKEDVGSVIGELRVLEKEYYKNTSDEYRSELFYEKRSVYNAGNASRARTAALFIFLNKTAFNGLYRENSKGHHNVPHGRYKAPNICDEPNLRLVAEFLRDTTLSCTDYKEAVSGAVENDFVYFDPPYYPLNATSSFTSYSKDGFLEKEQIELAKTFKVLARKRCLVMLSNSNTSFVRELYKDYSIYEVAASRAINSKGDKRGSIKELVIRNY